MYVHVFPQFLLFHYLGYSDQAVEGDWRWIDCSASTPWQESLWVPDHPGNGRLDCAALQPDGQIIDLVCDTPLSYLCEISPKGKEDNYIYIQTTPHQDNSPPYRYWSWWVVMLIGSGPSREWS